MPEDTTPRVKWSAFAGDPDNVSMCKRLVLRTIYNDITTGHLSDRVDWVEDIRETLRDENGLPFPDWRDFTHYSYPCSELLEPREFRTPQPFLCDTCQKNSTCGHVLLDGSMVCLGCFMHHNIQVAPEDGIKP